MIFLIAGFETGRKGLEIGGCRGVIWDVFIWEISGGCFWRFALIICEEGVEMEGFLAGSIGWFVLCMFCIMMLWLVVRF